MGRENNGVGKRGETIAAGFLRRKGYEIVGSNIRTPFGELDLVARKDGVMAFVEVKTRATDSLGPPLLNVTWEKRRHIIRSALAYLKKRGLMDAPWRIDVISVKLDHDHNLESIEHIENAVEEEW